MKKPVSASAGALAPAASPKNRPPLRPPGRAGAARVAGAPRHPALCPAVTVLTGTPRDNAIWPRQRPYRGVIGWASAVAAKRLARKGERLGNPNGADALRRARKGNTAAVAEIVRGADERAEEYRETLDSVREDGHLSLRAIADELNRREVEAPRGGRWYPASVARLQDRLQSR